MSVFIDKLNKLTRGEPASIGFRREQSTAKGRKIQLIASLPRESADDLTGADAGLVDIPGTGIDAEALKKMPGDIPWGAWLKGGEQEEVRQLKEAGCDFIVFPAAGTPLSIIEDKEVSKILEIDTAISDGLLRSVIELPVDAVLVSLEKDKGDTLTWQDLMILNRFSGIPKKPLLACIPEKITGSELEALWEAGVTAVVAEVKAGKAADSIGKLRKAIDKAEFSSARKRDRAEPVLNQPDPDSE